MENNLELNVNKKAVNSVEDCYQLAKNSLLQELNKDGHWEGELSSSALSTATACLAISLVIKNRQSLTDTKRTALSQLVSAGIHYILTVQNEDGGWGDTDLSISNISTSMLCHAILVYATKQNITPSQPISEALAKSDIYIKEAGGLQAVIKRYGKDKTFSVPILTHCALAGIVDWKKVPQLPFELACFPAEMYAALSFPVVSYALPALIAIGIVRFNKRPWAWPVMAIFRTLLKSRSLNKLKSIQPVNGGFLEATPLTSFVTMSLADSQNAEHEVVTQGLTFLEASIREDGSWPIDTNLATWVSTLSINALAEDLPDDKVDALATWLLGQQYRVKHPYTNAAPGGWAWTHLPGGVPDADDTPGALMALITLNKKSVNSGQQKTWHHEIPEALKLGVGWLLNLQNRDGGWPTFCRGWGTLPFDRSANDITAHVLRALAAYENYMRTHEKTPQAQWERIEVAKKKGYNYLKDAQRDDGSWLPLWFGNQFNHDDENPVFGTARVLKAYSVDKEWLFKSETRSAVEFLGAQQNDDGGWGGRRGLASTIEETAITVTSLSHWYDSAAQDNIETFASHEKHLQSLVSSCIQKGLDFLASRMADGNIKQVEPIGFYFAKLWYYEKLYPLVFACEALRVGRRCV